MGFGIRKSIVTPVRICYRSVCNHPFLAGMVFFLIFLYRSFPLVFSLLVSASPVLVCTAILLGTLLSFGHPNIPEIEKEENITHVISPLKTGAYRDDNVVVERDNSYAVERKVDRRGVFEKSIRKASLTPGEMSEAENDNSLNDKVPLSEQNSQELQFDKELMEEEAERKLYESDVECKRISRKEKLGDHKVGNHYSQVQSVDDEIVILKSNKLPVDFKDSQKVHHFNPLPHSHWKSSEDGEEEDDEASDSGSDGTESSSPDASMADIIPMLDELHPLLDEEAPQRAHMSHDGSDAASERSVDSNESDEDSDPQEKLEAGDDNDDDVEEEEAQENKEEAFKSAIKWTEDDQKNLVELGMSELERNQRLESLIARRRARKNFRAMTEKNLIDLDGADFHFNIAPISTARQNPFDAPGNSSDLGIPGSAPSVLLPRRNPFDLPYDSNEEKPDLMEDSFQQEFTTFQLKDPIFRRHESFNVGHSFFVAGRQERHDLSLRPYFVPERMASRGTTFPTFQRQSSDVSDSKVSSVPDSESMSSAENLEDKKLVEEDFSEELKLITSIEHQEYELIASIEHQESELITSIEHASEHIGHGSQSSDDTESLVLGQGEMKDAPLEDTEIGPGNMANHCNAELIIHETDSNTIELTSDELGLLKETVEEKYSSSSSSSSESEMDDKMFDEKVEELSTMEPGRNNFIEDSSIPAQTMVEKSDLNVINGSATEAQQKQPVYDSSPPAVEKSCSCSVSSDLQEMGFPPVLVKRTISFSEREPEVINQGIEEDVVYKDKSYHHQQGEVPSSSFDADIHVHLSEAKEAESMASSHQLNSSKEKMLVSTEEKRHSLMMEQVSLNHPHTPTFSTELVEVHLVDKEVAVQTVHYQVQSSNSEADSNIGYPEEVDEKIVCTHYLHVPEGKTKSQLEKELPLAGEHVNGSSLGNHQELQLWFKEEPSSFFPRNNSNASELNMHNDMSVDIHDDLQTEAGDEIKEIDVRLLFELDTVGDFSVKDLGSSLYEVDKRLVTGEETIVVHALETSSAQAVEVGTFELNETEVITDGNNLRVSRVDRVIDYAEEKMECGSKFQTPEASSTINADLSDGDFVHKEVKNPIDFKSIDNVSRPTKIDVGPSNGIESSSKVESVDVENEVSLTESAKPHEEQVKAENANGMPVIEIHDHEDANLASKQIDVEGEVELRESGVTHEGEIKVESVDGMPVFKARSLKDIDLASPSIGMKTEAVIRESEVPLEGQSKVESSDWMPVLEARILEDIDSAFEQSSGIAIEKPILVESPHDDTKTESSNMAKSYLDLQVEGSVEGHVLPISVKDSSHRAEPQGSVESTSDSGLTETNSKAVAHVSPKEILSGRAEKLPKSNSEDGSAEADSFNNIGLNT